MTRQHAIRLVGGSAGGRPLSTLAGSSARPTAASVREALANILRPRLRGARVLDLYAGYGTVGLELLSQGAASATFVELDGRRFRLLRRNVLELGYGEQAALRLENATTAVELLAGETFDIVFADPPYDRGEAGKILARLGELDDLLAPGGVVVIEHSTREVLPAACGRLERTRERKTGETQLSFYTGGVA